MTQPNLFENLEITTSHNHIKDEVITELRAEIMRDRDQGCQCPVCDQYVKLYKRNFNSAMSVAMIKIYQAFDKDPDLEWLKVEDYLKADPKLPSTIRGDFAKGVYWNLLDKQDGERTDGSKRIGYYKITQKGKDFVCGKVAIPKWVRLYNNEVLGFAEERVTIQQALGTKFKGIIYISTQKNKRYRSSYIVPYRIFSNISNTMDI